MLPLGSFSGSIRIVNSFEELRQAVEEIKRQPVLGFDTETRPSFKKGIRNGVSLLQLSCAKKAWLFRLKHTGLPAGLTGILSDPAILKIGVAIHDDIKTLRDINDFTAAGFIDLQTYVKKFNIQDNGLRKLAGNILSIKISKSQQLSDWEASELKPAQEKYAATDAWACYKIYMELKNHEQAGNQESNT